VQQEERKERAEREREEQRLAAVAVAAAAAAAEPKSPCHTKNGNRGGKHNNNHRSPHNNSSSKKKKPSRKELKEQRQRDRRMTDAMPPWANVNVDIACEHGSLKRCSSKSARARRRVMDKQAWKVLKRLYPDSNELEARSVGVGAGAGVGIATNNIGGGLTIHNLEGCLLCAADAETVRKVEADKKEREQAERRKPLSCPLVRGFYTRGNKGYPSPSSPEAHNSSHSSMQLQCPLAPGVYCALPRSWCHQWRKFIKSGGEQVFAQPDTGEALCDAHNLPLVPPHLEAFLRGETGGLFDCVTDAVVAVTSEAAAATIVGAGEAVSVPSTFDQDMLRALRAAGMSETEVQAQRVAMMGLEDDHIRRTIRSRSGSLDDGNNNNGHGNGQQQHQYQQQDRASTNEQLDRENRVVVEILTHEEMAALEKWWPRMHHGMFALRFAVVEGSSSTTSRTRTDILWSTVPCRECDPSGRSTTSFVVRNRLQKRGYR